MVTLTVCEGIRPLSYGGVRGRFSSGPPLLSSPPLRQAYRRAQECALLFRDVTRPPPRSLRRGRFLGRRRGGLERVCGELVIGSGSVENTSQDGREASWLGAC